MPSLVIQDRYTEKQKKEIMSVFYLPNRQQFPKYIEKVSEELFLQVSFSVQHTLFLFGNSDTTGSEFRDRGKDVKKTAKHLKRLLKGSNKGVYNSIDVMLAETMKMPRFSELNEYHNNKGAFVVEWFLEVLTLIEVTGHEIEHRANITKGKNYRFERELVLSLAIAWSRTTNKKPSFRRGTHFHKLVAKIFELERLGKVSERLISSALEMYT